MRDASDVDQTLEVIGQVLVRCVIIGVIVLFIWWIALAFMGDLTYRAHSTFTPMTRQQFNVIHYTGMLTTKAAVSLLFFFPYIAIRLVIKKRTKQLSNR